MASSHRQGCSGQFGAQTAQSVCRHPFTRGRIPLPGIARHGRDISLTAGQPRRVYCPWDLQPLNEEVPVRELPADMPKHPIGTFAFVGAYAVLFILLWYAIYVFVFLARHPVTP